MKQKAVAILARELGFLESLKVQLEDKDDEALEKSMMKYGLLVPIHVTTAEHAERVILSMKALRAEQIKAIGAAMEVIRSITGEFERSIYVDPRSLLAKSLSG